MLIYLYNSASNDCIMFYYNPAKNIGDKDYAISKMSRDMAVYSEVFSTREKERFCAGGSKRIWEL